VTLALTLIASPTFAWQFRDVTPGKESGEEKKQERKVEEPTPAPPVTPAADEPTEKPTPAAAPAPALLSPTGAPTEKKLSDVIAEAKIENQSEAKEKEKEVPANSGQPAKSGQEGEKSTPDVVDEDTFAEPVEQSDAEQPAELTDIDLNDPYWIGKSLSEQTEEGTVDEDPEGHHPLRFNGIVVGETRSADVIRKWGQPFKIVRGTTQEIIKYRTKTFRQVDLTVVDEKIVELLIHLQEPLDPAHCANELAIADFHPVPVPDEFGRVMGLAYPERGVLFGFRPADPDTLVSKIHLEPISSEPFVLRAQYDFERNFEVNLQDLDIALEMNPRYAKAHGVRAEILKSLGRFHDALDAAEDAVHYDPENTHYKLNHARLLAINGQYDKALRENREVLAQEDLSPALQSLAELQLGNLIAEGPAPRHKEAMQHHLTAIDLAAPLANDRRFMSRRLAKRILVDAHLAVARNISRGKYQRQRQVAPKWLSRGRALVEELISRDQGDPALRLVVYQNILSTAADLNNPDDPSRVLDDLLKEGRRQIATADDAANKVRLEWELGVALAEAVRLERLRGDDKSALSLADDALVLLQQSAPQRQSTPDQRYTVGRLYFQIGSLYAVHRKDHSEAIEWYAKAHPMLSEDIPVSVSAAPRIHGETFISMGVSYWKEGQQERAIELTEQGAEILQQAVVDGHLDADTLAIPYGNLASMHQQVGNESDAQAFAELATTLGTGDIKKR
jgi:tetratricopeptide (TPR) repeat protein